MQFPLRSSQIYGQAAVFVWKSLTTAERKDFHSTSSDITFIHSEDDEAAAKILQLKMYFNVNTSATVAPSNGPKQREEEEEFTLRTCGDESR